MNNPFSLTGQRILVTGATSGIGRCCAIELSRLGASIVAVSRRETELEKTLGLLDGAGHQLCPIDLSAGEDLSNWMKVLAAQTGPFNGLVHAAGVAKIMPVRATTPTLFHDVISINLQTAYFLAKAFRQPTVRAERGSVVFLGSVMSLVGQPGLTAYSASKGALVPLAKSLALELASESIRVNVVAPGQVHTPMMSGSENAIPEAAMDAIRAGHPLGIGRAEDVAYATAYLLSNAARWVTGTTLVVDGGYTSA